MGFRERSRGEYYPQDNVILYYTLPGQSQHACYGSCSSKFSSKMEFMADTVGFKQSDFNPCEHEKLLGIIKPLEYLSLGNEQSGYTQFSFSQGGPYPQQLPQTLKQLDFLSAEYLDDSSALAEDFFRTSVQDNASLINFLLELITLCEGNIRGLNSLWKKFQAAWSSFLRIIKSTGNYWVAWNFAMKPFVSDLIAFLETYKRAEKRLKWLRKHNHTDFKLHYRRQPVEVSGTYVPVDQSWFVGDPEDPETEGLPEPTGWQGFFVDYEGLSRFSSWAWVRLDIPDYLLDDFASAMGMIMMIMNGVYNPVKIIWEAIPFSWLIEWFTNKRTELLKELASLSPIPNMEIRGVGFSVKTVIVKMRVYASVTSEPVQEIDIGNLQYRRFSRRPGLPYGELGLSGGVLNATQLSILGGIGVNWRQRR